MLKKGFDKKLVLLKKNNNKTASWFLKIELSTELRMSYKINIYRSECKSSGQHICHFD